MNNSFELVAAPHTPCYPDGSVSLSMIDRQCEFLLHNGVTGVFVCGTTGEGLSFTTAERMAVLERWLKVSASRLKIIAHVGHNCQREAMELAAHAKGLNIGGVAAIAPHFVKPAKVNDLVDFLRPIAEACAPLPFLYYDIPSLTNVTHSAADVIRLGLHLIPNFGGIKFTNINAVVLQECLSEVGTKAAVYFGVEEMLLATLPLGIRQAVGSTFNYTSRLHLQIVEAFDRGNLAQAALLQRRSVQIVRIIEKHGGPIRAGKAAMSLLGLDLGPVRPPLAIMTPGEIEALHADLRTVPGLNQPLS